MGQIPIKIMGFFWLNISYYSVTSLEYSVLPYIGDHKNRVQLASCYMYSTTSFHLVHLLKIM